MSSDLALLVALLLGCATWTPAAASSSGTPSDEQSPQESLDEFLSAREAAVKTLATAVSASGRDVFLFVVLVVVGTMNGMKPGSSLSMSVVVVVVLVSGACSWRSAGSSSSPTRPKTRSCMYPFTRPEPGHLRSRAAAAIVVVVVVAVFVVTVDVVDANPMSCAGRARHH